MFNKHHICHTARDKPCRTVPHEARLFTFWYG